MLTSRTLLIIAMIVLCVVYVGGAIHLGEAPLFARLDSLIGFPVFMGVYHTVFFWFDGDDDFGEEREDPFTKSYVDFEKVRKNASE